jgi:hypothetical protein
MSQSSSSSFGGVASNTVRPFNSSFVWSSTQEYDEYEEWLENEYDQVRELLHQGILKGEVSLYH